MAWTLVAGDVFGLYKGYFPDFGVGSFSPSTIEGSPVSACITGIAENGAQTTDIYLGVSANITAYFAGKDITVNGLAYSLRSPPSFDGTDTLAIYMYGGAFVPSASYSIDFVTPGGGVPEVFPPYVGTDDLANLLIGGETVAQIYIGPDET